MNIGIDIGGTHIRIGVGTPESFEKKFDFPTQDFEASLEKIRNSITSLSPEKGSRVGIAVPGPIETRTGELKGLSNLPSWRGKQLAQTLKEMLNLEIRLGHDASLAALAESKYGAGIGKDPLLYYTVSTGIGVGLVYKGEMYQGLYNPEAGQQIVTGVNQSLEKISSGSGLREITGKDPQKTIGTADWDKAIERLGRGITNSILHYSPEIVIIGGGLTTNQQAFFEPLTGRIRDFLTVYPLPEITKPKLGEDSTLIGALELTL